VVLHLPKGVAADDVHDAGFGEAEAAIEAFQAAGGVVRYSVVDVAATVPVETAHLVAAMSMIESRAAQIRTRGGKLKSFKYSLEPARAASRQLTVEEFLGPYYDREQRRLVECWGTGKSSAAGTNFLTHGYADAFSDTPYGLRDATVEQRSAWFNAINRALLGGLSDDIEIFGWSTDWSDFFTPGLEWWGAFCWTVRVPHITPTTYVGIGASTTD
jgi:hypothetical protein